MNKKGFIFSLTAIYYAIVVMLFLSLLFFSVDYYSTTRSQEKAYYVNNPSYLRHQSQNVFQDVGWCVTYLVYDADSTGLNEQSELEVKKYCEDYER